MDKVLWIVGILLVVGVVGFVAFTFFRKRAQEKVFGQIYRDIQMVPKAKRRGIVLLMFKESMENAAKKKHASAVGAKFQNPKYLEIQLKQMNTLLKNPDKAEDKVTKKALALFSQYEAWERQKAA